VEEILGALYSAVASMCFIRAGVGAIFATLLPPPFPFLSSVIMLRIYASISLISLS